MKELSEGSAVKIRDEGGLGNPEEARKRRKKKVDSKRTRRRSHLGSKSGRATAPGRRVREG